MQSSRFDLTGLKFTTYIYRFCLSWFTYHESFSLKKMFLRWLFWHLCLISIVIYKFILINDQSEDFILAFALRFDFTFSDYYLTFLLKCIRFWPTMKDLFSLRVNVWTHHIINLNNQQTNVNLLMNPYFL